MSEMKSKVTNDLSNIPPRQAYEWVKTGVWDLNTFEQWVGRVRNKAFNEGSTPRPLDARIGHGGLKIK